MRVLVVDGAMQAIHVISIQHAAVLLVTGKAIPASDVPICTLHSAHASYDIPAVIRVTKVIQHMLHAKPPGVTRRRILVRDNHVCQFITNKPCETIATTVDHLIPVSKGGLTSWDNCVASCLYHNGAKEDRDFEELQRLRHWQLRRKPDTPRFMIQALADPAKIHPEWIPYIQHLA